MTTKVFVSSVIRGLEEYREAVAEMVNRLNISETWDLAAIRVEIDYPAKSIAPLDACFEGIDDSELCLCILGSRYGDPLEDGRSASEQEFDYATSLGRPILAFIVSDDMEPEQARFKGTVSQKTFRKSPADFGGFKLEVIEALRDWFRVDRMDRFIRRFKDFSDSVLFSFVTELYGQGTIQRTETDEALKHLKSGKSVLLLGDKGVGKSAIISHLAGRLSTEGTPHLVLDTRSYPHGITSSAFIGDLVGTNENVVAIFREIADKYGSLVLLVDDLSLVSETDLGRTLISFIESVQSLPGVMVVATSRAYDIGEDANLTRVAQRFANVTVTELSPASVQAILDRANVSNLSGSLKPLSGNLLYLNMILELSAQGKGLSALTGEVGLWEAYIQSLRDREGDAALARAHEIASLALHEQEGDFALSLPHSHATQRLLSARVILNGRLGRFRFPHEDFAYYLYARSAAQKRHGVRDVLADLGQRRTRRVLPYLHLIYQEQDPSRMALFLKEAFGVR